MIDAFRKYWKTRWSLASQNEEVLIHSANYRETKAAFEAGYSENSEKVQALELAILNIKYALLKEIKWCRDNQNSEESQKAFIAGLEQAQRLINGAQKTLLMDERYGEGFLSKV